MKRKRNPAAQFRMPGGHSRMHLTDGGMLDVAYASTDWGRPGAKRTLRILPTSTGHRGSLVRDLIGKDLTADDLLAAAIEADASAQMMLDSYPRHVYRSAAHYYEGLSLGLLQLAAQLQGTGWRTNPKGKVQQQKPKARPRRNGLVRVPDAWIAVVVRAYLAGGGVVHLPLADLPYPKIQGALAAKYPRGIPVEVSDEPTSVPSGGLSEPSAPGGTFGVQLTMGQGPQFARTTGEHELRHLVQVLGTWAQGRDTDKVAFGLPSRASTRALRAGADLSPAQLKAQGLKSPRSRQGHYYFHDAPEWQPWIGSMAQAIAAKLRAAGTTDAAGINAAIRQATQTSDFYKMTAAASRRELLSQLYTEVQRLLSHKANPVRPAPELDVLRRLAKKHGGKVTRTKAPYWVEFPSRQKAEAFDMDASVHGFFTEATMRPLATGGTWCVPVRSRA